MSPLSSRRYTECVDRLNSILGKLSAWLNQNIKKVHEDVPTVSEIDFDHRIVRCGNNVYQHSSNPAGVVKVMIWKDGWVEVLCAHDTREASEIIQIFEWKVQP